MARMTPLQARKKLLVATAVIQRNRFLADLESAGTSAGSFARTAQLRLRSLGIIASAAAVLVAFLSSFRRPKKTVPPPPPRQSPLPPRESLLLGALPILRLLVTAWLSHRPDGKR